MAEERLDKKIEQWKSRLLDFSKRNRLLNFKVNKSTLLIDKDSDNLFNSLLKNNYLTVNDFIDIEEEVNKQVNAKKKKEKDLSESEIEELRNKYLVLGYQKLEKHLNDIRLKGKSSIEEKGVNTLYLACGFLNWTEVEHSKVVLKSPLFLMPVSLIRTSSREPYSIKKLDDDLIINPVLEQKLKLDFGVNLTPLDDVEYDKLEDLISYYNKEVKIEKSWNISDEVYLGLFSFSKIVMFKDFESYEDIVKENIFVKELAGIKQENYKDEVINISEHDKVSKSMEMFQILDADSSQQEAILAAKKGLSFVMQGPPGTGKSQTITNIITESLAQNKKVLFVSEKRAALEVVKKKLDENGLSNYCLDLHSHNSNKKAVLEELKSTLDQKTSPFYMFQSFADFDETKKKLHSYVEALHTHIHPLNQSPQKIHGHLSKLSDVSEVLFDLKDVNDFNSENLLDARKKLKRLEEFKNVIGNKEEHLWSGVKISELNFELESKIKVNFNSLAEGLHKLLLILKEVSEKIAFEGDLSIKNIDHILDISNMIENKPKIPSIWLEKEGEGILKEALKHFETFKNLFEHHNTLKKQLIIDFSEDILSGDIKDNRDVISIKYKDDINKITNDYPSFINSLFDQEFSILEKLNSLTGLYAAADHLEKEFHKITGIRLKENSIREFNFLQEIYGYIKDNPQPTALWFHKNQKDIIRNEIKINKKFFEEFNSKKSDLAQKYDLSISEQEIEEILNRYLNNYNSFLRIFKGSFRKDKNLIQSFMHVKGKIDYDQSIKDLRAIAAYRSLVKQSSEKEENLNELLGRGFEGANTDWNFLSSQTEKIFTLTSLLEKEAKTEEYLPYLLQLDQTAITTFENIILNLTNNQQEIIETINSLRSDLIPMFSLIDTELNIHNLKEDLFIITKFSQEIVKAKNNIDKFSKKDNRIYSLIDIEQLYELVTAINTEQNKINNVKNTCEKYYGDLFLGIETDWFEVKQSMEWIKNVEGNYNEWFPPALVKTLSSKSTSDEFLTLCNRMKAFLESLQSKLDFYEDVFNAKSLKFHGEDIYKSGIENIPPVLVEMANNTSLLLEWITFQEAVNAVKQIGLEDFLNKLEQINQLSDPYEEIFMKRFYRLWLDAAYQKLQPLKQFRIDQHSKLLQEFKELDSAHIGINSSRLHGILTDKKEKYIQNLSLRSPELSVLKREIQKQKKHKPIRALFGSITELLLEMKPCMMMSPLSVSQFIDPSKLIFDIVIFDEASQIRPEDAIGSMIRGKQIIIAGDDKQLPPTSFFNQQLEMDEEFISEEDEEFYENFESILDECLLFMPSKSLSWHYRSKQESLISFSNSEIYNNELYTFPNSTQDQNDGVSFVQVKDGIYDRGKSNKNLFEAEKVAQLVFDHIQRNPNRSLGVISFSEAQQNAIRDKIDELKSSYPECESFFNENKFEAFFVKNIENVQGDERDTIILSVGYGKDVNGLLHYNFGPLNKDGGERRLNVAVTRAKYEMKVVSSITDNDLDDAKLKKRGPKLLKAYLTYAKNGGKLSSITQIMNNGEVDSPFEQDVFDALTRRGLEVRKQVGCSGYRIDLAVVDPDYPGRYLLGIECDGATYHSSKTARDRDRLRQSVLESLGWRIFRIWSQDWVKRKKEIIDLIIQELKQETLV